MAPPVLALPLSNSGVLLTKQTWTPSFRSGQIHHKQETLFDNADKHGPNYGADLVIRPTDYLSFAGAA